MRRAMSGSLRTRSTKKAAWPDRNSSNSSGWIATATQSSPSLIGNMNPIWSPPNQSSRTASAERRAVTGDGPEPGGEEVSQHAGPRDRAHGGKAKERGGHRVAGDLAAVADEPPPALARQQLGHARAGGAAADDQSVVFGL